MFCSATCLRAAARWLAACALAFHVAWLPVHLNTQPHCAPTSTHQRSYAHAAHHGHGRDGAGAHHSHPDADQHHFTGDHESNFLSKRHVVVFAPLLAVGLTIELISPPTETARVLPCAKAAPPPADFSPPSGPRAPPLA